MKKKLDELKDRPKEERTAIAGGAAVLVVVILFLGWAIIFFKKVRSGAVNPEFGPRTETVDFSSFRDAASEFSSTYSDDLQRLRDQAARAQIEAQRRQELQAEYGDYIVPSANVGPGF